ncbi:biotin--[acetyl-CoA-carboxylase] ligase [Leptotrichia sp. oral taxon 879]|uniref:Biotin--[acetyl-CoA-carboxylase] ligase n=1 Tax=Leptotrichia mesophila TaxID=3239303 RepID=A0AB39VBI1_9FUSO|nr:biotin--[acetyl-CoA-carboxylase] ligase [Leptotrichia sp. oral taxon 879]ERK53642.1 biotin--[acetyl-CoA-carboxylase] ligase [Leptotrichia sp. oral taxon 879 str. F0557]
MKFKFFDEINSTNTYLRRQLRIEEFEVIVAKKQTDGRGKRDSVWISNEGAALFSFAVADNNSELDEKITIFTGYIVYEVLKNYIKSNEKLTFKWPNDIYYENKKICGILCEKVREHIIVGIGININNTDFGMFREKAISLVEITGKIYSVQNIIEDVVSAFENEFHSLNRKWENILTVVNENNYLKDKKIVIKQNGKFLDKEYKFLRVDRRGNISLIAKGDSDELKFASLEFKVI